MDANNQTRRNGIFSRQKVAMNDDILPNPKNGPLAALAERLIYMNQRARHCRRVAQSCGNAAVARTLEEMAERFEAEARALTSEGREKP